MAERIRLFANGFASDGRDDIRHAYRTGRHHGSVTALLVAGALWLAGAWLARRRG